MNYRSIKLISLFSALFMSLSAQAAEGNPVKGAELFKQCAVCHMVGADAQNTVGPTLNHIFGRKAAAIDEYTNYSPAMKAKGDEGLLWDEKSLYTFIAGPKWFVPETSMGFEGLRREKEIKDLLSWLIQYSPAYEPNSMTEVSQEAVMAATLPAYSTGDDGPEDPQLTESYLAEAEPIKVGGELWGKQCRHCHGNSAYPGKAPKLTPATYEPDFVFDRLTNGFRKMPAWKSVFSLDERRAIVSYILSNQFAP